MSVNIREFIRILILSELKDKPMHGYAIMEKLSKHGRKASAGMIYPLLSSLKRSGLIEIDSTGDRAKKTYRISEKGLKFLDDNAEKVQSIRQKFEKLSEISKMGSDIFHESLRMLAENFESLDEMQKKEISRIIKKAAMEIRYIIELGGINENRGIR